MLKTSLANMVKPVSIKSTKISRVWWHTPVIPAAWEAEAENYLNPGDRGSSEPRSHHCSGLGDSMRLGLKKKKDTFY